MLGCVAQQEGEKIFERAPMFAGVRFGVIPQAAGDAGAVGGAENSRRRPGSTIARPTRRFETEFTARTNPHRGYITIIEGCDKFCAYCVVPLRAAKSAAGPRRRCWRKRARWPISATPRFSCSGRTLIPTEIRKGRRPFAELLAAVAEVRGIRRVRFTTSHPRDFGRDIVEAIDAVPTLCDHVHLPVQSGSIARARCHAAPLYPREYLERIAWIKAAKREISITTDVIVGFPGETETDFCETLSLLEDVPVTTVSSPSSIRPGRIRRP